MDFDSALNRLLYTLLGAFAGAITALAFMKWKEMSKIEIALTVFVGFSFAVFVTPWLAQMVFGVADTDIRVMAGLTYVSASASNTLLPKLIRKVSKLTGPDEEVK